MSCVHYKFKSSREYYSVTFDGIHISLGDLKKAIINQKKMRSGEFDLEITNAQNGEVYKTDDELIPKNSSVVVSRIPLKASTVSNTQKAWEAFKEKCAKAMKEEREQEQLTLEKLKETGDLANAKASEMDKIKAMIDQSTRDFDPSNYRGKHPTGPPPAGYNCHRCGKPGHYIQNCNTRLDDSKLIVEPRFKRSTGIPASFLTLTDDPTQPGALLTHTGQFAVPTIDAAAYAQGKKERPPFLPDPVDVEPQPQRPPVPKELLCSLCDNLLTDAVVIPCCGISYCDECIRNTLLETDDRQCPHCFKTDISPDNLIANVLLRTAVTNFLNETGYTVAMFKKKEIKEQALAASVATPPQTSTLTPKASTPTSMSQMDVVRAQLERDGQLGSSSPSDSVSSRGSHRETSRGTGRPLTVLGASGNSSPSEHNSRSHRSGRDRYHTQPPRSSSYPHHHHHQRKWSDGRGYPSREGGPKPEPLLPRSSAAPPPLMSTAPAFTSTPPFAGVPPLLPSLGFLPRPSHPLPQPPPPGVTAPPPTYPPAVPPPFTAPPPAVAPSNVPPYAPAPYAGPVIPGVASRPPPAVPPLSEQEFYQEKQRLREKEGATSSSKDVYEEFANFLKRNTKGNRARSRSGSPGSNPTPRRRSRSYSRSRSRSPSPSRSFRSSRSSLKHSRSPRSRSPRPLSPRSRTPRSQSYSPVRSRSRGRLRTRSRSSSRSPRHRGPKRFRSRSRSYSRSPPYRSPRRSRSRSRKRGRFPSRRGYLSRSRSRSRSRSLSPRYSRSLSPSPRRRRSPLRFNRKRSPSLSRSRSKSPFKEPLGAPVQPNWHRYRSPPQVPNRNFATQNFQPRYQQPGGPNVPFQNGPGNFMNYPGQTPMQRPPYFGEFFPPQFPNQPGHTGPPPFLQGMPRAPRPPFDRQFYDNRGVSVPFRGPAANSPPRAKSPFKPRIPGERRADDRREPRNRDFGERRGDYRRDGQDRRDGFQRRRVVSGDRKEGGLKRKADADAATPAAAPAAGPAGAATAATPAPDPKPTKIRKVKKRPVDGKKENKEGKTEKEEGAKKKEGRVSSKSRHSSGGAKQDKLQERKVVVSQETEEASRRAKPSSEKSAPSAEAPGKEAGNPERQVVKAERSKERSRKVVSAAPADQAKPVPASSSHPGSGDSRAVPTGQSGSEPAAAEAAPSKVKVKRKKIRVRDPKATVAAAASAAAASVTAAPAKVDDDRKKLMRLKRFQEKQGGSPPPKKSKREPTPPGLGKPMDLRLGSAEPRHRDGPDYDLPELSKWERDDVSRSPTENPNPHRKVVEKKPLPRSVIEKAESALANKPLKPSVKPTSGGASPAKPARRVYMEEERAEAEERKGSSAMQITVSKSQRRVSESRRSHSSDRQHVDADVRRVAKSDHHKQVVSDSDRRKRRPSASDSQRKSTTDSEHHKRATSTADHHKRVVPESDHHRRTTSESNQSRRVDGSYDSHRRSIPTAEHHRRGDDSRQVSESASRQVSESASRQVSESASRQVSESASRQVSESASRQVSESASRQVSESASRQVSESASRQVSESATRDKTSHSHSHSSRDAKKADSVSSSSKSTSQGSKGQVEEKPLAPKEEKLVPSNGGNSEDIQKPKESKSYLFDRKESMMDEATFEPDYDEQSGSESSMEEATTTAGEQISTMSSGSHTDRSSTSPSKRRTLSQDTSSSHHKKSKKKHKHKNKHKHKHKKRKHKKNKEREADSEDA